MKEVAGKVAFVTGGASGIGRGIANAFVEAGMNVVLADLRQDRIDDALAWFEERGHGASVHGVHVDVTDRKAMAAAADETEGVFDKLHVLVSNAGVGIQGPFDGITYADWDFGLAVNLGGVVNGIQAFLPRIRAHGEGGHIVSTASLAALVPMPAQYVIYVAAKAAVIAISETIRAELAQQGIGVSVVCPGPVRTNIREIVRPPQFGVGDAFRSFEQAGGRFVQFPSLMEPSRVGAMVLQGIRNDELYIITHGEWRAMAMTRHSAIVEAMPKELDPLLVEALRARAQALGAERPGSLAPQASAHCEQR